MTEVAELNTSASMETSGEASPSGSTGQDTGPLLYMDDGRSKGSKQDLTSVPPIEIPEQTLGVYSPSVKTLKSTLRDDAPISSALSCLLQTLSPTGLLSANCDGMHFAESVQEHRIDTDSYVAPDGSEYFNIPRMPNGSSILGDNVALNIRMIYIAHHVKEGTAVQTRLSTREINMSKVPDLAAIEIARREYMAKYYPTYGDVSSHAEPHEVNAKPPSPAL